MTEKLYSQNTQEAHFCHAEKNYVRMSHILTYFHLLCALISASRKQNVDLDVSKQIYSFYAPGSLATSLMPAKIEGHFVTELATQRGVKSLNRQLLFCVDLIKENKSFKNFQEKLKQELPGDMFRSGCIKGGIERQYSLAEQQEQTMHRETSMHNLVLIQTALHRMDFFKEIIESNMSWKKCRAHVQKKFPDDMDVKKISETLSFPQKGLSTQDRAHLVSTGRMVRTIASIDHRLHSMILTVIEKKYPQWRMR